MIGRGGPAPVSERLQVGRAAAALAAYEGAQKLWHTARTTYHDRFAYTVTVSEDDYLYGDVHEWLLDLLPEETQRALTVSTSGRRNSTPFDAPEQEQLPFRLLFNDRRRRRVDVAGHRVTVEIQKADQTAQSSDTDRGRVRPDAIVFTCHSKAAQDAVLDRLREIHDSREKRKPTLRVVNQWGNWVRRADLPERELASVVLPDDQKAAIVADLRDFLDQEQTYNDLAIPWHRGYLLHGPPGTGKTSLAKALACEFNLDLWYVALGDLPNEASLIHLLSEVGPRSMLLLEDIDTVQITHDRTTQHDQPTAGRTVSLSSLLNALDGVATPHGLISVTTTNHFDKLDKALVRAGRMDRVEELALPTWLKVDGLWRRFYGSDMLGLINAGFPSLSEPCPLSQAEVSEVFKRHLTDAGAAARALGDLVVARG